jgi:hypothetical protein
MADVINRCRLLHLGLLASDDLDAWKAEWKVAGAKTFSANQLLRAFHVDLVVSWDQPDPPLFGGRLPSIWRPRDDEDDALDSDAKGAEYQPRPSPSSPLRRHRHG